MRGYARLERLVDEPDFRRRGRGEAYSQRQTLTLDQYHALWYFSAFGGSDVRSFFCRGKGAIDDRGLPREATAVVELPSGTRARCVPRPVRVSALQAAQHVAGLGILVRQVAPPRPVFSTHKMSSITARWPIDWSATATGARKSWEVRLHLGPLRSRSPERHVWP